MDNNDWGQGGRAPDMYTLQRVLEVTSAIIRKFGWRSRGQAYETGLAATADHVSYWLNGSSQDKDWLPFRRENAVTDDDTKQAEACREYWVAHNGTSDYDQNATLLAEYDIVINRAFGLAVSLLPVWRKRQDATNAARMGLLNEHTGTVGKRQEFTVKVRGIRNFDSPYGAKDLVTFRDTDGRELIWWASGAVPGALRDSASDIIIVASVKDHKEYRGTKQTVLTRVKVKG